MSPAEVLDRLSDRFRLLAAEPAGVWTAPHARRDARLVLRPAPVDERLLLDRLCVFAGSFDLAAVEAVCVPDEFDDIAALDAVASLVDKSMVVAERPSVGTRYRLLETVRQYAERHAADQGDLADLRVRHLAYYRAVVESAGAGWLVDFTSGQVVFDREWDNVRAATQTALANARLPLAGTDLHRDRLERGAGACVTRWATGPTPPSG